MSEPYYPKQNVPPWGPAPRTPKKKKPAELRAIACMVNVSAEVIELEEMLGGDHGLTAKEYKRLDKAVTVLKVGLKIMKKAMNASRKTGAPREQVSVNE